MNYIPSYNLEPLLPEEPFGDLLPEEKRLVWAAIGEEEYEQRFRFLQHAKTAMKQSPAPDPAIRQQLLAAMKKQRAKAVGQGALVRLLQRRIPVWQAAATIAALLGFFFLFKHQGFPGMQSEKVYVYLTDTVYKEVSLPAMDSAGNVPFGRVNVKPGAAPNLPGGFSDTIAAIDSATRRTGFPYAPDTLHGLNQAGDGPKGNPAHDWEDWWQFLRADGKIK
ncbi:MAG: hypothetical protein R2830_20670 [Saprospiraceae bacterium]